jgi:hypothetical protein
VVPVVDVVGLAQEQQSRLAGLKTLEGVMSQTTEASTKGWRVRASSSA